MPTIQSRKIYETFFRAAKRVIEENPPERIEKEEDTQLYRYVDYRAEAPQNRHGVQGLHGDANKDTHNRWTGWGTSIDNSARGLYLSSEFADVEHPFPELDHYTNLPGRVNRNIIYFDYRLGAENQIMSDNFGNFDYGNLNGQIQMTSERDLKSMFGFVTARSLVGVDLTYNASKSNDFLSEVYNLAKEEDSTGTIGRTPLLSWYEHRYADFCRAVGNACALYMKIDFLETTSVRDPERQATNVVLLGENIGTKTIIEEDTGDEIEIPVFNTPENTLLPQGRTSFFASEVQNGNDVVGQGIVTIADLLYNRYLEIKRFDLVPEGLMDPSIFTELWDFIESLFNGAVQTTEASADLIQDIREKVTDIRAHLDNGELNGSIEHFNYIKHSFNTMEEAVSRECRLLMTEFFDALITLKQMHESEQPSR